MSELISELQGVVKAKLQRHMAERPLWELSSLSWVQELALEAMRAASRAVFEVWVAVLVFAVQDIGLECPRCGRRRKLKMRSSSPMHIDMLSLTVQLPKPYLECGHCNAKGLSVLKLLTGLSSGEASAQVKLLAAYCASKASYGKARQEMQIHHGQELERTRLRRMALEVEQEAVVWAEEQRRAALGWVGQEARQHGVEELIVEGDGGKVRTGELVACEVGDAGFGKKTPKRGLPRRKRPTTWREMITLDVRKPGADDPSALDVLVPVLSPPGERSRRMLAAASRSGLGDNTAVWGLGDMGSELASSFDDAFFGYCHQWSADWHHTKGYVEEAAKVLRTLDDEAWRRAMKDALWQRDRKWADELVAQAKRHRMKRLPSHLDKCPVAALNTYLKNNWRYFRFAQFKKAGLPTVSARAEAQVRDRTKDRYAVAGAWKLQNLEGKATLRAIVAEGSWETFRAHFLDKSRTDFEHGLSQRIQQGVAEGRITDEQAHRILAGGQTLTERTEAIAEAA
jgi:hypothetical protein